MRQAHKYHFCGFMKRSLYLEGMFLIESNDKVASEMNGCGQNNLSKAKYVLAIPQK